ncbi:MAG: hypothetical protein KIT89_05445 [Microcella sp.]|uniref:hypothetical protein n=1 Tax=Microcella sp. TaxID=1913979 RepID=UPI0024CCD891|nr:hypothetical protein [Microcella sp.]UYN84616.1 MAG: hypothetical protein KIT89_05445 [Microcella sp.]
MTITHRTTRPTASRLVALFGAIMLAAALLTVGGHSAPAAAAPMQQCNGVGGGGGEGYDCTVTITNQYDVATGLGSSTMRTVVCNGGANTDTELMVCVDSGILSYPHLTETVNQCNGTVGGGGASLYCSVSMTNTIVGDATTSIATVNQCIGSLGGGGVVPGSYCDPIQSTTGATINQCNGSVTGTGNFMVCTVESNSTANSAFDVSITQCDGSADGNGSVLVCDVSITTIIVPAGGDDGGDDGGDNGGGDDGGDDGGSGILGGDGSDSGLSQFSGNLAATGPAGFGSFAAVSTLLLVMGSALPLARRRAALR